MEHKVVGSTPGARILVVDDDIQIRRALRGSLVAYGYAVELAASGAEGLERVTQWRPDVIILDLSLPDMDGLAVCRELRGWSEAPIIILSVRGGERDKIAALDQGADDYLTKPFGMGELIARIRVALRHATHAGSPGATVQFRTGDLVIDFERRRVTVGDNEARLTPTEYEVLKYLAAHAGMVVTHRALLQAVWGPQYGDEVQYLRVFIGQLRRKIEPVPARPRYLLTEPGIGYRLHAEER
jgi:two-component system KDP operon response regulator KdpE